MYKKFLASFLLFQLVAIQFVPSFVSAQSNALLQSPSPNTPTASPPPVTASKVENNTTRWSSVDWKQKVILPEDADAYVRQVEELYKNKKDADVKKLMPIKTALYEEKALQKLNPPLEVRNIVKSFVDSQNNLNDTLSLKQSLFQYEQTLTTSSFQGEDYPTVDIRNLPKSTSSASILYNPPLQNIQIKNIQALSAPLPKVKIPYKQTDSFMSASSTSESFLQSLKNLKLSFESWLIPTAYADPVIPIIQYTTTTPNYPLDLMLYSLGQAQNANGSFGSYESLGTTEFVVNSLATYHKTDNTQYLDAMNYLMSATSTNNRERAIKVRFLQSTGQAYGNVLQELLLSKNPDGGYGYDFNYASDLGTTLEVLKTLTQVQYNSDTTPLQALSYILNQVPNDGNVKFTATGNTSYLLVNQTLETLYPLRNFVLVDGQNSRNVMDTINRVLSFLETRYDAQSLSLTETKSPLDPAMSYANLKLYARRDDIQKGLEATLFHLQDASGGFGDAYTTAVVLKALAEADIEILSVTPQGNWVNGNAASLTLRIKNRGYKTVTDIDLYNFIDNFQFSNIQNLQNQGLNLVPGQEMNININFPDTRSFIGSLKTTFYFDVQGDRGPDNNWGTNSVNVASAANGAAAVPVYFVAQKGENASGVTLNISWPKKADNNRQTYIASFRQKGQVDWIDTQNNQGGVIASGFSLDRDYEVSVGSIALNGTIIRHPFSEVKINSSTSSYKGTLSAGISGMEKIDMPLQVDGYSNLSTTTNIFGPLSFDETGNGTNALQVTHVAYENLYTKFQILSNQATTNIRIFTHLKPDTTSPVITSFTAQMTNAKISNQKEVKLSVLGTDNVALKEADFYYYDPQMESWVYIATQSRNITGGMSYMWYIPSTLVGQNFKFKAILWDYRGNPSLEREWGPFQILDGTPPVFSISSPLEGQSWDLGRAYDIVWGTQTPSSVNTLTFNLINGSFKKEIAKNIQNTGRYTWNIPFDSYYAGSSTLAIAGKDTVSLVNGESQSSLFTVNDPSPKPSDPWSLPTRLSLLDELSGISDVLSLTSDASGTAYLVYKVYPPVQNAQSLVGQVAERLLYRKFENGVWSSPLTLYDNLFVQTVDAIAAPSIRDLKLAADTTGKVHLVWQSYLAGACTAINAKEISYLYFDGLQANPPINISNTANIISDYPDITLDASNTPHVVWQEGASIGADCRRVGNYDIKYSKHLPAGWSPVEVAKVFRNSGFPKIVVTRDNTIHLVFYNITDLSLYHKAKVGNVWGADVTLNAGQYAVENGSLAAGPNNVLYYTYEKRGDDRTKVMYNTIINNVWGPSEEVSEVIAGHSARRPQVAPDTEGVPHVAYVDETNGPVTASARSLVWKTKNIENNTWDTAQKVSLNSQILLNLTNNFSLANNVLVSAWVTNFSMQPRLYANTAIYNRVSGPPLPDSGTLLAQPESIRIGWRYAIPSNRIDHFDIYRSLSSTTSLREIVPLRSVSSTSFVYTDTSTLQGKNYYYAIVPVDRNNLKNYNASWLGPASPLPPRINIIRDGNFEAADTNNWRAWGSNVHNAKSNQDSFSGTKSMWVDGVATHVGFQQLNVPVIASSTYKFSFWYKMTSVSGTVESNLGIRDSNADFEKKPSKNKKINDDWQYYSREFTVPGSFVQDFRAIIRFMNASGYVDDVVIEKLENTPLPVLRDADMEALGLGPWISYGRPTTLEKTASSTHGGTQSLHVIVPQNAGAQETEIALLPNRSYRLRLWYRVLGTLIPRISTNDSSRDFAFPNNDPQEPFLITTNGEWRQYERTFTTLPDSTTTYRLVLMVSDSEFIPNQLYRDLPFGEAYIDDITLDPL